ncbi:CCA tRNA nucleotidyltransferase [Microcoleus sp. FACHB-831]|uniref:CCA tRNA nucleotidyltransferase n=1 Tax=Microcoleus sp. FACHB-831 TaxID=2692827 RepID=UPI0016886227|nr:CCA tRNA nucleotidyltransferase [Microcoleus sp. FACHB-831]MBD1923308.1 CCA tRNA nucleotidyltransferase [Microcoleus sp. FACHB-831]
MHLNTESSALSPENWPFSLELLPQPAYLVGGAVRDALLERRREYLDLDFVIPTDAVNTARKIAAHYNAGFVLLDADRQIARVVFKHATADFAQAEGGSLEADLYRRDYRMNAIAYNPRTGEIIDPLEGYADLQQGIIRMVSAKNLQDDPLRLLRGYRQAAQLNFNIEPETRSAISKLAPLLSQIAAERVRVEFSYLLGIPLGTVWITAAFWDGLLPVWFPNVTPESLEKMAAVDSWAVALAESWPELKAELSADIRGTIKTTLWSVAKLATLLPASPEVAEEQLFRLKYSRVEIRAVTTVIKCLPTLISGGNPSEMPLREQYFFFRGAETNFLAIALLAVTSGVEVDSIAGLINRYLNPDDQVAHPTPLITGNELMEALKIPSGQLVGQILGEIQASRAEGKISTPAEALEFASQLLDTK